MSHHEQMLNQFEQNHTLSVSDIQEAIPDAKQSEIYKNLMQMEQDGVIERVQTKGTIKYELADAEGLNDHVVQGSNFSVTIESVCADCR
jgi:Fe2+ or Zn2+ uptake regulation protein